MGTLERKTDFSANSMKQSKKLFIINNNFIWFNVFNDGIL